MASTLGKGFSFVEVIVYRRIIVYNVASGWVMFCREFIKSSIEDVVGEGFRVISEFP